MVMSVEQAAPKAKEKVVTIRGLCERFGHACE